LIDRQAPEDLLALFLFLFIIAVLIVVLAIGRDTLGKIHSTEDAK
jgi:hypothetical protein